MEGYERLVKRAKVARGCEDSSGTPSTMAYLALLTVGDEYNSRYGTLFIENQRSFSLSC